MQQPRSYMASTGSPTREIRQHVPRPKHSLLRAVGEKAIIYGLTAVLTAGATEVAKNIWRGHVLGKEAVANLKAAPYGTHRFVKLGDYVLNSEGKPVLLRDISTVVAEADMSHIDDATATDVIDAQLKGRGVDTTKPLPTGTEVDLSPDARIGDLVTPE